MALPGNVMGGKYRILQPIAEGAMGSVWQAVHVTLERPFAVKILKEAGQQSARLEDRFLNEARRAAAVRHRFVVDVVDFGRTEEGTPYMVMEYLEGLSLAQRLRKKPRLLVKELLRIMQQALEGLEAVHRAGVLHRDLKPENIMLCPDGDGFSAKLVDFGISRDLYPASVDAHGNRLTNPGTTLGTPWYMAPEQVQGLATIDQRCDVYAAGVVLYEALTGRLPYSDDDVETVLLLVATGGAVPVAQHRPDLPAALCAHIDRAMAVDPAARFESARELAVALDAVAPEVWDTSRCRRFAGPAPPRAPAPPAEAGVPARVARLGPSLTEVDRAREALRDRPRKRPAASARLTATERIGLARSAFVRRPWRATLVGGGALLGCVLLGIGSLVHLSPSPRPSPALAREANTRQTREGSKPSRLVIDPLPPRASEPAPPRLGEPEPVDDARADEGPSPAAGPPAQRVRPSGSGARKAARRRAGASETPAAPRVFRDPGF